MKPKLLALILGMGLLFGGCAGLSGSTVGAHIEGGQLGFEVEDDGTVLIWQSQVTFSNQANASPVTINGYSVEFRNRAGNRVSDVLDNYGGIDVYVPAGIICPDGVDDGCTGVTGGRPGRVTTEPINLSTLRADVAMDMLQYQDEEALEQLEAVMTFYSGEARVTSAVLKVIYPFSPEGN